MYDRHEVRFSFYGAKAIKQLANLLNGLYLQRYIAKFYAIKISLSFMGQIT
jgi:hypothetical protein